MHYNHPRSFMSLQYSIPRIPEKLKLERHPHPFSNNKQRSIQQFIRNQRYPPPRIKAATEHHNQQRIAMEIEDRTSSTALLERQHKNHIAEIMIRNAKSFAASAKTSSDPLGSSARSSGGNSTTSTKSNGNSNSSSSNNSNNNSSKSDEKNNGDKANNSGSNDNNRGERKMNTGRWSADEHKRFLNGLDQFGTGNWKKITDMVGTRSCTQIRTHAQKYFIALQKPANDGTNENGGYSRKKSKMLIGADHHLNSNIKTGSSAIITGYGGGGTPIHPSGIVPVTGTMGVSMGRSKNGTGSNPMMKQFWGAERNSGLTGMEVLAQAAITGEKRLQTLAAQKDDHLASLHGVSHSHFNQYESSLDKAVAELRKKMASENDGKAKTSASSAVQPSITSSSDDAAKQGGSGESSKRKLDDARAAAVVSMHAAEEHQKKLKQKEQHPTDHINYAAAVQDTIDRKDVLDKLQAAAERQEFMRLKQENKNLNQTVLQLQQQSIESENRVMEAITDRRVTLNECKNLREINVQLKQELRRMVLLFEHSGAQTSNSSALMAAATQGANVELMQARLTESELRYHTVTESLSRQTGVLTDQHRAILELNSQLEKERAKCQALEFELKQLKKN